MADYAKKQKYTAEMLAPALNTESLVAKPSKQWQIASLSDIIKWPAENVRLANRWSPSSTLQAVMDAVKSKEVLQTGLGIDLGALCIVNSYISVLEHFRQSVRTALLSASLVFVGAGELGAGALESLAHVHHDGWFNDSRGAECGRLGQRCRHR
eukprot:2065933-Pleurochrysis_carterae.AAC.1